VRTTGDPTLTLVILAAGLGRRYGDIKQLAGVGPDG
jgi:CTP:molybdopterin cytidylyltransferase MocA